MSVAEFDRPALPVRLAPVLFTATIFLSASLLFFVQPLFAKIVLPEIGGAASVWTTAMLFFQSVLLGGYLYAHLLTKYVPVRGQVAVHLAVWAAGLLFLPLGIPDGWTWTPGTPAAWATLTLFALGVGVPFAALAANAPLIQSWYARSDGPAANDPYFLYGASNLGSFVALLGFPLVAEPLFGATLIGEGFSLGYVVLGAGLLAAGLCARPGMAAREARATVDPVSWKQIGLWLVLAFVPSSLMLAVTTRISTDVGALPLVWVLPLSLYLLSFVVTFRTRPLLGLGVLRTAHLCAVGLLAALFLGLTGSHQGLAMIVLAGVSFFAIALYAHARLYQARPAGAHLTLFYLVMSVGGALGGLFNSILSPVLFDTLAEGPITLLIAGALAQSAAATRTDARSLFRAVGIAAVAGVALHLAAPMLNGDAIAALGLTALVVIVLIHRKTMGAGLVGAAVMALIAVQAMPDDALFRDRSFFGIHHVGAKDGRHVYTNGTTLHGAQEWDLEGRPIPLTYYHETGPMARVLNGDLVADDARVGVVGLGVGALACHARPTQTWAFYEIDPVVDRIARDPALFTFLSDCTPDAPTHMGDARVVLEGQDVTYDVLVIDAYSSDAVPVHLTTTEAMALYADRLSPNGLLIYHISNRYYDIALPLGRSATQLGLSGRVAFHDGADAPDQASSSRVAVLSRDGASLDGLDARLDWQPLADDGGRAWTDDYANPLGVLMHQ